MPAKNVVILDGAASGDNGLPPILSALSQVLKADGAQVEVFPLRDAKLAHCLGCFGCWKSQLNV
jgi:multimeric flavodoxin WrbA